jgi:hypothetical protein
LLVALSIADTRSACYKTMLLLIPLAGVVEMGIQNGLATLQAQQLNTVVISKDFLSICL